MVTYILYLLETARTARSMRTDARAQLSPARAAGASGDPVERACEAHAHGVPRCTHQTRP
eukprot:6268503-Pyramimonas_sp.AAC.1